MSPKSFFSVLPRPAALDALRTNEAIAVSSPQAAVSEGVSSATLEPFK